MVDAMAIRKVNIGGTAGAVGDSSGSMAEGWTVVDKISAARSARLNK